MSKYKRDIYIGHQHGTMTWENDMRQQNGTMTWDNFMGHRLGTTTWTRTWDKYI